MPVEVPSAYIADAPIDWHAELSACLSVGYDVAGVHVPAPAVGHMALLEWLDCRAVSAPFEADHLDCVRALYVLARGPSCAGLAMESGGPGYVPCRLADVDSYTAFDRAAMLWASDTLPRRRIAEAAELVPVWQAAFAGWGMIPPQGEDGGAEYLFGPEGIAGVLMVADLCHLAPDLVIWRLPLCLVGHIAARRAAANGTAGVARPKDKADIRRQLDAAAAREAAGEIHPWQRDRPDWYGPTRRQMEARPAIQRELFDLHEAWKARGGRNA